MVTHHQTCLGVIRQLRVPARAAVIHVKMSERHTTLWHDDFLRCGLRRPPNLLEHRGAVGVAAREIWLAADSTADGTTSQWVPILRRRIVVKVLGAREDFSWPKILWRILRVVEHEHILRLVGTHRVAVPRQDPILMKLHFHRQQSENATQDRRSAGSVQHRQEEDTHVLIVPGEGTVQKRVWVERIALAQQALNRAGNHGRGADLLHLRDSARDVLRHELAGFSARRGGEHAQALVVDAVVQRVGQADARPGKDVPAVDEERLDLVVRQQDLWWRAAIGTDAAYWQGGGARAGGERGRCLRATGGKVGADGAHPTSWRRGGHRWTRTRRSRTTPQ